jgi:histidine phosphotransfer protein HptB
VNPKIGSISPLTGNQFLTPGRQSKGASKVGVVMIDWNRVRQLQEEIGKDEFAEVVMLFLDEADDVLAKMQKGSAPAVLADNCHFLKGAALNLGFQSLAAMCQAAERLAKAGDFIANVDEMRQCYRASRAALLAGLGDLAA